MRLLAAALALGVLAGCFGAGEYGSGEREWNVARKTATEEATFENRGTRADVLVGWRTDSGAATLRVLDGTNATVLERALEAGGTRVRETTAAGAAGTWRLVVEFEFYTGRVAVVADGLP